MYLFDTFEYGVLSYYGEETAHRINSLTVPSFIEKQGLFYGDYSLTHIIDDEWDDELYIDWLANYLYEAKIMKLSSWHQSYFDKQLKSDGGDHISMASILGDDAFWRYQNNLDGPIYNFPSNFDLNNQLHIEELQPHINTKELTFENLDESQKDGYKNKYEYVLEDHGNYVMSLLELKQLYQIYRTNPSGSILLSRKADAGCRPILSAILKNIPNKKERLHVLNKFFDSFFYYWYK